MTGAVGTSVPRLEAPAKVRGAARYVDDLVRPGMLYARLVRSAEPHAVVDRVDAAEALALDGVVAVLSADNIKDVAPDLAPYDPACHDVERPDPSSVLPGDFMVFSGVARYIGDPVALVIATSDAAAIEAAKLVEVEYTPRPAVFDPEHAQDDDAPEIHAGAERNVASRVELRHGDAAAVFDTAAATVEARFSTSKQKQAQLELTCAIAEPDPGGGVIVWSPSQSPHRARHTLARAFGLRYTDVRVINPVIGGAFGKGDALTAEPYAVAAALLTGRPVKVRFDRHEDFVGTESRHPSITSLAAAVRADGTIAALRGHVLLDGGAYLSHSPRIAAVLLKQLAGVYDIEAVDLAVTVVFTNTPVSGAFRGYGGPQAAFPLEHLVDLGAREVGVAPLAARRAMLGSRDALRACLERGEQALGSLGEPADARYRRGVGMAALTWKSGVAGKPGTVDQSGASVRVNADGTIDVLTAACDLGTGATTALAQIAADALGVPLADVRIPPVDTAMTAYDSGAFASRTLYRAGRAVHDAAALVRAEILDYAGELLEVSAADLTLADGVVAVRGAPARSTALREVLRHAMFAGRAFLGLAQAPQAAGMTAAAHVAVVDVDTESGRVLLRRLIAVQDVGRAVNPGIVEGQIAGAAYQGLGYALTEDLVVDRGTGEVLTGTFMDYRLPTVVDGPRVEAHIVEFPDPDGPFGAKGAGEPSIILPAPAIANAVLDAVGVSMTELPITPERVWQALRGR